MIRFIQCVRRKPGMSVEEFRRHWTGYIETFTELSEMLGAKRIACSFSLSIRLNDTIRELRGTQEPFDAVLEIWWEHGAQLTELSERPEIDSAISRTRELQAEFIDVPTSSFFFASEELNQTLD